MRAFISKYWKDILILLPVLLIAAYFRLDDIRGYQVFLGDQGRDALIVKRMIADGDPTFIGPNASVGGFFLGPLYYYMMIIPMILSQYDPVGPAVQVALLSLATIGILYYYLKRYICIAAALIGSAVYAVSVLIVEYARFSWNPNVLPFFVMILILAWTKILSRDSRAFTKWFVIIGVMLGSIAQLHYAALIMGFVSGILYLWHIIFDWSEHNSFRIKIYLAEISLMIFGFIAILTPFIGFEIKNNFPNTKGIYSFIFQDRDDGFSGGAPFEYIIRDVSNRLFLRLVAGGDAILYDFNIDRNVRSGTLYDPRIHKNDISLVTVNEIVWVILLVGTVYGVYRLIASLIVYVKNSESQTTVRGYLKGFINDASYHKYIAVFLVMSTWWVCGVGWWGSYKKSIYDYYFSYMYPLPIIVFAIACALILHMYSRRLITANPVIRIGKLLVLAFVGVLVFTNIARLQTLGPGWQVDRTDWATDDIIKSLGEGKYNFALISEGNSDHAYRFFLEIKGYKPVPIDEEVTDQLIVLCEIDAKSRPCEPEGNSLWEVAGFGPAKIVGQSTTIGFPLYRLQHIESEKWRVGKPAQKGEPPQNSEPSQKGE